MLLNLETMFLLLLLFYKEVISNLLTNNIKNQIDLLIKIFSSSSSRPSNIHHPSRSHIPATTVLHSNSKCNTSGKVRSRPSMGELAICEQAAERHWTYIQYIAGVGRESQLYAVGGEPSERLGKSE